MCKNMEYYGYNLRIDINQKERLQRDQNSLRTFFLVFADCNRNHCALFYTDNEKENGSREYRTA